MHCEAVYVMTTRVPQINKRTTFMNLAYTTPNSNIVYCDLAVCVVEMLT